MVYTKKDLISDFAAIGLTKGDSVIVHSSCKSIGKVEGGAETVIEALLDTIQSEGTLLFPNLNIWQEFNKDNPPCFDLRGATVRKLGIIPEIFKFHYATHFSIHPTHSLMGRGKNAGLITPEHELAGYPCGPGTPWKKNIDLKGKILLLGVTPHSNTSYHCVEEHIKNSYRLSKEPIEGVVVVDGKEMIVRSYLHAWAPKIDFSILNKTLEEAGYLKRGRIGEAESLCISAKEFFDAGMEKVKKNPQYFRVEK